MALAGQIVPPGVLNVSETIGGIDMRDRVQGRCRRGHRREALPRSAQVRRFLPTERDRGQSSASWILHAGVSRHVGNPHFGRRGSLDGSEGLAQTCQLQAPEAATANHFRGRAIRRDERAPVAGQDVAQRLARVGVNVAMICSLVEVRLGWSLIVWAPFFTDKVPRWRAGCACAGTRRGPY